jgi:hypothetical protein
MFDGIGDGAFAGGGDVGGVLAELLGFQGVGDLLKAMSVGDVFPAAPGDLTPGKLMATVPQDLDDVLHNTAFNSKHILGFNKVSKGKAWSTVHQFVRHHSPGSAGRRFLFHREGGLPPESDSTFSLEQLKMRYLGSVRRLPIQARLVKNIVPGGAVKKQNADGSLELLEAAEFAMFYGDNSINPYAFDGLKPIMEREGLVLDAAGQTPTEALIDEAMEIACEKPNWGHPTDLFCSPRMHKTLRQLYAGRMRSMLGDRFHPNYRLSEMGFDHNNEGENVNIIKHPLVIEESPKASPLGEGPDASRRPVSPIIVAQPAPNVDTTSKFGVGAGRPIGDVKYQVAAINEAGVSAPVATNTIATEAGKDIRLTVKDGAVPNSLQSATGFLLYRTEAGVTTASEATLIKELGAPANGANLVIIDLNEDLPGTSEMFIVTNRKESIEMMQLLPMFNFPLGNLDTSFRWALLLFVALKIGTPRQHVLIKNVKPESGLEKIVVPGDQSAPQLHI